jgi:GTP cyclohydrolase II
MDKRTTDRLRKLNIEPESELAKSLIKLDSVYEEIETINKQQQYLRTKKQQLKDDADMMEMLLMHKFNTDTRKYTLSKNMRKTI